MDSSFKIIDTHLHLWDPDLIPYPWLEPEAPSLNKKFLLEDYNKAIDNIPIDKMVFVQCECDQNQYLEELKWVTKLAKNDPRIQGIIPWAPLEKGDTVREELEFISQNKLVKGIRRIIQHEKNDLNFCLRPDFIKGVNLLPNYNLSFDICIGHIHMANTIKFVKQCPEVSFMLNHIGKPDIKNGLMEPWKSDIKTLASFQNVFCKLSGLVTEADLNHWAKEDLKPYFLHVLECFGIDRLVFGGDWPVVTLASSMNRWYDTLNWLLEEFSKEQKHKLFYSNAEKFYKLQMK